MTATPQTVEEVVRHQLATALGGKRGMLEAAIPTIAFTVVFLTTRDLRLAIVVSVAVLAVLIVARLVQKQTLQFCFNALLGIGLGALFAWMSARGGGDVDDQALAYFLPGILISAGYFVAGAISCLVGWPLMGFILGSVTDDPVGWHEHPAVVQLCARLTWVMVLPGAIGVALQGPVWLLGDSGVIGAGSAVATIAALRIGLGWPLRIGALVAMVWLLTRDKTPIDSPEEGML